MSNSILLDAGIFLKKYEMCKELGKGSFGVVFEVKDREDGKCYAAKHFEIRNQEQNSKVTEEIKILQKLKHPQIIEFIGAYGKLEEIFLVTELLNGGELFERIVSDDFEFTESKSAACIKQLLLGLDYLHKNNIIHVDMKPENIVCISRESIDIKIIDFGLAVFIQPGVEIRTAGGTADYMAPEQLTYDSISTATDMWSVGVISYILLSGLMPFTGTSNGETQSNIREVDYCLDYPEFHWISEDAKEFIFGLLKKEQEDRLTAQQGLDHPWVLKQQSQHVINTDNLKNYLSKRKIKKCYNAIVAVNRLAIQETPQIEDLNETDNEEMKNTNTEKPLTKDELEPLIKDELSETVFLNWSSNMTKNDLDEAEEKNMKTIDRENEESVQLKQKIENAEDHKLENAEDCKIENAKDHSKLKEEELTKESSLDLTCDNLVPIEVETVDHNKFIKLVIDDTLTKDKLEKPSPLKLFSRLFSCFRRQRKYKIKQITN